MDWRSQVELFMPHGMCLLWQPALMSLHVISDALIALAYFVIPVALYRFVHGRHDLELKHLAAAGLFAAFIALCGLTHILSIVVLWVPLYVVEGWLKAVTALVSVATASWLVALVPNAVKFPSVQAMQREIAAHHETESELHVAERDLHRSVALLRTVVEVVPGLIYVKDRSGRMLLANRATLDLIGRDWTDVEGKRDDEFLGDPRQATAVMANDRRIMAAGVAEELEEVVDHPINGTRVYLSKKVPFGGSGEEITGLVGLSIDITERKELDKEFLQVARRTAMGDMAAAIAHEINQPLAAIAMYLGGCLALLAKDQHEGPVVRSLATAREQCVRAGEIIRRVRTFVSGGEDTKQLENATLVVDEACGLVLLGLRESGVVATIEHDRTEIPVIIDKVQIEQVIVNLVRNAMDAMGTAKGMTLRVATGYGDDGMAMVSVTDSGPGISAEVVSRLFEPFVSTKGLRGIGVGLSICRTIIEGHGGRIWADPDAGQGTTFRFTLPAASRAAGA